MFTYGYMQNFPLQNMEAANIRILNASFYDLDAYIDNRLILKQLKPYQMSKDISLLPTNINIKLVSPKGLSATGSFYIAPGEKALFAAVSASNNIYVKKIPQPLMERRPDRGYVRFVSFSDESLSVKRKDKTLVFPNLDFAEPTEYILAKPGKYTFNINDIMVATTVDYGAYYTIFIMSYGKSLKFLISTDRIINSPFKFCD